MVFAFAGLSTITSFFDMARDTLAIGLNTPRMPPRPSPVYILVAALSWPLLYGLFRLRARGREHLPDGGYVLAANHNSNLDPWPLGLPLFPRRYLRFMGKSELFWTPFKQFATAAGAFPVRRGERDTEALATAAQLCREGHIVVMFPEGTRRKKGMRKKYEARAHTGAARIALEAGVPLVPAGIAGTDRLGRLAKLRVAYGPPIKLDDLTGREDAPQVATERLMAAIGELERSA
jgi:1-acyl-sn-glycerol-3-phosphate acyltransferase